jgi:hypothetical protein
MATKFPKFSQDLQQDPTTRRVWYAIATAHDFESHDGMTEENLYQKIFASHFGHLAIIFLWASGILFHVAWQGNFETWVKDPLRVHPIAHAIWDRSLGHRLSKLTRRQEPEIQSISAFRVFITGGIRRGCERMPTCIQAHCF